METELPDKVQVVLKCDLSAWQRHLYRNIMTCKSVQLEQGGIANLNNTAMQLRKVCNHPYLFLDRTKEREEVDFEQLIRSSGKLALLFNILPKLKAAGHRVLLFSQMVQVLNIIEVFLEAEGYQYLRLDGVTKTENRAGLLEEFNRPDSDKFIFLLSTRSGGQGINLQTADTVIIFDSDWNPQMDAQVGGEPG